MARLDGRVALITGAARGMGASHARLFVAEGARVVLADVSDDDALALAQELGDSAVAVHLDVTDPAQWEVAVATAVETFGGLDILVNNAGISVIAGIEEITIEQWDRVIAINLTSVFLGIRAAIPALKLSAHASIVNISSTAGLRGYPGVPAYNASKFGVRGLTKGAAIDLAPYGIRVNSIHPGTVHTPMTDDIDPNRSHVLMGRMGEPLEISYLALFLASDESSFSTGAEFVADGGETAGRVRPDLVEMD